MLRLRPFHSFILLSSLSTAAFAQDARDEEIFGGAATPSTKTEQEALAAKKEEGASSSPITDSLLIGGRLEIRTNSAVEEQQQFSEGRFTDLKQADIYFDSRPNPDLRAFLRARFSEATTPMQPKPVLTQDLDELWFKWDIDNAAFFTLGKQHLKWGSGRFWNPTDFVARETRDPFALFDRRLGQEMLKIHIPNEKLGFNYYAVIQWADAARNDDMGLALRGEFAFLGTGELAVSAQKRRNSPLRLGVDVSSALGPIDIHVEAAFTKQENRLFYKGELDPATSTLPQAYEDKDKTFTQVNTGLQKTWKYNADDTITFGAEYFYNELGYEKRYLELYSLAMGQSRSLYAGRRYAGAYVSLPQPGSWNKSSFFLNGMQNISDQTSVVRLTGTYLLFNEATLELFASRCLGDYGEFCFRAPANVAQLATHPSLSPEQQAMVKSLPTKRTLVNAGMGLSMQF